MILICLAYRRTVRKLFRERNPQSRFLRSTNTFHSLRIAIISKRFDRGYFYFKTDNLLDNRVRRNSQKSDGNRLCVSFRFVSFRFVSFGFTTGVTVGLIGAPASHTVGELVESCSCSAFKLAPSYSSGSASS